MTQDTLGLIGVGAFGAFIVPHLKPHFDVTVFDAHKDLTSFAKKNKVKVGTLRAAARCDVVVLAVPVQKLEDVLKQIKSHVKKGALIADVASVKIKPTDMMKKILPKHVDLVGLHPLFGPQSGKNGIKGLNIALCPVRGKRTASVAKFLRQKLKLNVLETTSNTHDKELAYVQGLTHLIAKVVVALDLPAFKLTTKTFEYMSAMVETVRYDSDELFKAIERENPFTAEAKKRFFASARQLEEKLTKNRG